MKKKRKALKKLVYFIFFFILIAFALQIAPNYAKQVKNSSINLYLNNENITDKLFNDLFLQNDTVYISITDIKNVFDDTITIEETSNKIITVFDTKVAAIHINEPKLEINSAELKVQHDVIYINDEYYVPISYIEKVYNLETRYIEDSNIFIVNNKDKELIGAKLKKKTSIKTMKNNLSLTINKLKKDEEIIIMNNEQDGWLQVRTTDNKIGYIKDNNIKERYFIRENMEENKPQNDDNKITKISELKGIKIPKIEQIKTYDNRTKVIEKIVNEAIKSTVKCLEIDYAKLKQEDEQSYNRFLLELEANLKDVGIMLKNSQ